MDKQGTYRLFFWGLSPRLAVELLATWYCRSFVRGGEALLRTRGMVGSRSVYGKAPHEAVTSIVTLEVVTPKKAKKLIRRCHPYARKSASQAILSRMQLTYHATRRIPHGASRLVLAMPAWSVKTRRAPSRHFRDVRVYGHTTTAMHDMSLSLIHI